MHTRVGESTFIDAHLARKSQETSFNAGSGVQATNGGATITIPPSSLVTATGAAYTGAAKIAVTAFDPSTRTGQDAFPGRFEGVQTNGTTIPFRSLGFVDFSPVTDAGAPLQLKPGARADIIIPVSPVQLATAPATIPLWFFNPQDSKWHEEGSAVLSGGAYRATITHFSIWNCDVGVYRAYVIGRVINCADAGQPVRGARVSIRNLNAGWTSGEDSTPAEGTFRIPVNAGEPVDLWAEKGGQTSRHLSFTAPPRDQTYDTGDICLGVPKIQIVLTWADKPVDLDAHLTIPNSSGSRDHLYFSQPNIGDAQLDTDDTNGYGPEIISVYKLHDGVYRYSVHHFAGEGLISTSRAYVHMAIEGKGIFEMRPPASSKGVGDVWGLWNISVQGGNVVQLTAPETLVNDKSANDADAFNP